MTVRPRVAVVGAGLMGVGIAQVFAATGHLVAITDANETVLASVPGRLADIFALVEEDDSLADHVTAHRDLRTAVADADLVIEAAAERLDVKREIFRSVSEAAPVDAILTSNTSAIPIHQIASAARNPAQVLGAHFWNPPYFIPLVEVVQSAATDTELIAKVLTILRAANLEPVHVRSDVPGFVGNRLQHALKREAIALVAAGVCDAATIDTVTKRGFGARLPFLGPLEQSDMVGLELTLDIHRVLLPDLDRTPGPHPFLEAKVRDGHLGMQTGSGFREWSAAQAEEVRGRVSRELRDAAIRRRRTSEPA